MRNVAGGIAFKGNSGEGQILAAVWLVMVLLAGCMTVGPNYTPPDPHVPEKWSAEVPGDLSDAPPDIHTSTQWWSSLNDPVLTNLITRAVDGNFDVRKARARLRETRARWGISRSDRFPTLKTSGSATLSRTSSETGGSRERKLFESGFDATWELDLFGGVQRSIEAAEAELEASLEDVRDVLVSLEAEVALNYVEVRLFQNRLSIAAESLELQEETCRLTAWRHQAGLTSQLDVDQARSNLEETRSQIPSLQTGLDQALNRLAVLLGENPGSLNQELSPQAPIPVTSMETAIGVPAEVLRRLPTVRRAERRLAAQTAQVGLAYADLYPKFTLTGSIGLESLSLPDLFSAPGRSLRIGPNFSWILFDAGRLRQNIEVRGALQEQALLNYELAVLTALEDVENALTAYAREQVRKKSLQEAAQAAQSAMDLARSQYSSGLIDFQAVLDSQRSWLSLKNQLAVNEGNITSNLIRLYKALGGGWTSLETAVHSPSTLPVPSTPALSPEERGSEGEKGVNDCPGE
jgi:NodT family efflux transporter outer membrane factor (OMF) lipoprotein